MKIAKHLDLVVLALALPIFAAAGFPLAGWAVGAAAYVAQLALAAYAERKATASEDTRAFVGWVAGSMIGRGWLVALTIFAAGLADEEVGLAAAVLFLAVFTVHFTTKLILRPFERPQTNGGASA